MENDRKDSKVEDAGLRPPESGKASGGPGGDKNRRETIVRWLFRGGAILSIAFAALLVLWGPVNNECRTERSTVSKSSGVTEKETESCVESSVDLVDVLPLVALAGVLLLGEISELSIPGLVTLKTRIENQEVRQERLERDLIRVSTSQSQNLEFNFQGLRYQNPQAASQSAHVKVRAESEQPLIVPPIPARPESDRIASMSYRVLEAFEEIQPFILIGEQRHRLAPDTAWYRRLSPRYQSIVDEVSPSDVDKLMRWYDSFKEELASVRAVRNSVAHPPALVTESDLEATLDTIATVGAELNRLNLWPS